ncbi:hypothetical protein EYF80_013799 [Liparis tanakae]|uniref:Uncharacterized protein n=1 Tax=Liparis tanakae TaxID=230148 RepID=A0A4Z2IDL1_9TELE|nr:hypothetical protein EYF80_013799 [Liparis tanakae]
MGLGQPPAPNYHSNSGPEQPTILQALYHQAENDLISHHKVIEIFVFRHFFLNTAKLKKQELRAALT